MERSAYRIELDSGIISRVEKEEYRTQYMLLSIEGNWDTCTLQRNLNSQYLNRTLRLPEGKSNPQHFFHTATIKCAHFHDTEVEKPIPDYKEFGGTVFEMANRAVDFVLSKISLSTGTRAAQNQVTTTYEIPRAVIAEAIINAAAHRDYFSKGSIQVSVFKDRVEVLNPGTLPDELDLSDLRKAHGSYPHNPLLANCMFLTGDIERYGTGTLEIFRLTKEAHLHAPQFDIDEGFRVILWRISSEAEQVPGKYRASTREVPRKLRV